MRYNDDVINAESWNTDLKKEAMRTNPGSDKIAKHQSKTVPNTSIPAAVDLSGFTDAQEINHTLETDLQKTGLSREKEAASITDKQPADENSQVSHPDMVRISSVAAPPVSKYESARRINKRKKRGMFLLSGLITGLVSRSRNHR